MSVKIRKQPQKQIKLNRDVSNTSQYPHQIICTSNEELWTSSERLNIISPTVAVFQFQVTVYVFWFQYVDGDDIDSLKRTPYHNYLKPISLPFILSVIFPSTKT